jgi:hypothetical protein
MAESVETRQLHEDYCPHRFIRRGLDTSRPPPKWLCLTRLLGSAERQLTPTGAVQRHIGLAVRTARSNQLASLVRITSRPKTSRPERVLLIILSMPPPHHFEVGSMTLKPSDNTLLHPIVWLLTCAFHNRTLYVRQPATALAWRHAT